MVNVLCFLRQTKLTLILIGYNNSNNSNNNNIDNIIFLIKVKGDI